MVLEYFIMQIMYISYDSWSLIESLPFHLCTLMTFNTIFILLTKKQWAFELMLFIGLSGALHALFTPQLNLGNDLIYMIDFFSLTVG